MTNVTPIDWTALLETFTPIIELGIVAVIVVYGIGLFTKKGKK